MILIIIKFIHLFNFVKTLIFFLSKNYVKIDIMNLLSKWNREICEFYLELNHPNSDFSLDIDEDDFAVLTRRIKELKNSDLNEILLKYVECIKPFGFNFQSHLNDWKKLNDEQKFNEFPSFFIFIPVLILPFNSGKIDKKFKINNFYDILYDYWEPFGLFHDRSRDLLQTYLHPEFWKELEYWLHDIWDNEKGTYTFKERYIGNNKWYVTHFFEQVAFRKQNLKRLPKWFKINGILPNTFVSNKSWLGYLQNNTSKELLNIPDSLWPIIKDKENPITKKITQKISLYHKNWDGVIKHYDGTIEKYENTIAPLKLCLNIISGDFGTESTVDEIYFRLYSKDQIIENLSFSDGLDYQIDKASDNWSKKIENLIPKINRNIKLVNNVLNWCVQYNWNFPIILTSGSLHGLKHWIETKEIIDFNRNILLIINNDFPQEKLKILNKCNPSIVIDYNGLIIYKIKPSQLPKDFLSDYVFIESKIKILIHNNLTTDNGRSFFKQIPPIFSITNSTKEDEVFLEQASQIIPLDSFEIDEVKFFKIPNPKELNDNGYRIKTFDSEIEIKGNYYFKEFTISDIDTKSDYMLNSLNKPIVNGMNNIPYIMKDMSFNNCYDLDNPRVIVDKSRMGWEFKVWKEFFNTKTNNIRGNTIEAYEESQNALIEYLSVKREISITDFNIAYDIISKQYFKEISDSQRLENRRTCFYSLLSTGYIETDYNKRLIYINSPLLIQIPIKKGIQYFFVGCRSKQLVNKLTNTFQLEGQNIKIHIKNQDLQTEVMVPQTIRIKGKTKNQEIRIKQIANSLNIKTNDFIIQEAYIRLSENINEFAQRINNMQEQHLYDYSGGKYFCHKEVKFINVKTRPKKFDLIKYNLEYGKQITLFWKDKIAYEVNVNYACFYFLKKKKVNIILYDAKHNYFALPATISFPFFIERGLTLQSGYIPEWVFIKNSPLKNRKYNLYTKISPRLAKLVAKKLGQTLYNMTIKK